MYSPVTLMVTNMKAVARAAQKNKQPYVINTPKELNNMPPFPFPDIGSHEPEGWKPLDDTWFVDSSGLGSKDEPALTMGQFISDLQDYLVDRKEKAAEETIGFAVVLVGLFQVHVRAFRKET